MVSNLSFDEFLGPFRQCGRRKEKITPKIIGFLPLFFVYRIILCGRPRQSKVFLRADKGDFNTELQNIDHGYPRLKTHESFRES